MQEAQVIAIRDKKAKMPEVVRVKSVGYLAPYRLRVLFDDGRETTVDFGPFLKESVHPSIRAYLDVERFRNFTLEDGVLHWSDFDLVFPMADLYEGRIKQAA
jgi:hypothetical protein